MYDISIITNKLNDYLDGNLRSFFSDSYNFRLYLAVAYLSLVREELVGDKKDPNLEIKLKFDLMDEFIKENNLHGYNTEREKAELFINLRNSFQHGMYKDYGNIIHVKNYVCGLKCDVTKDSLIKLSSIPFYLSIDLERTDYSFDIILYNEKIYYADKFISFKIKFSSNDSLTIGKLKLIKDDLYIHMDEYLNIELARTFDYEQDLTKMLEDYALKYLNSKYDLCSVSVYNTEIKHDFINKIIAISNNNSSKIINSIRNQTDDYMSISALLNQYCIMFNEVNKNPSLIDEMYKIQRGDLTVFSSDALRYYGLYEKSEYVINLLFLYVIATSRLNPNTKEIKDYNNQFLSLLSSIKCFEIIEKTTTLAPDEFYDDKMNEAKEKHDEKYYSEDDLNRTRNGMKNQGKSEDKINKVIQSKIKKNRELDNELNKKIDDIKSYVEYERKVLKQVYDEKVILGIIRNVFAHNGRVKMYDYDEKILRLTDRDNEGVISAVIYVDQNELKNILTDQSINKSLTR